VALLVALFLQTGAQQPLGLESPQRDEDGGLRHLAPGPGLDLEDGRDRVRLVFQAKDGEQVLMLQIADRTSRHGKSPGHH